MVLPHEIDSQKALPNAAAILMAAQTIADAPVVQVADVPVAPKAKNAHGGIAMTPRIRRQPQAARRVRPRTGFTQIAKPYAKRTPFNRGSHMLLDSSQNYYAPRMDVLGLSAKAPTVHTLDVVYARAISYQKPDHTYKRRMRDHAKAVMIRDTLLRRFAENSMDMADGVADLPRMVDAERRQLIRKRAMNSNSDPRRDLKRAFVKPSRHLRLV